MALMVHGGIYVMDVLTDCGKTTLVWQTPIVTPQTSVAYANVCCQCRAQGTTASYCEYGIKLQSCIHAISSAV